MGDQPPAYTAKAAWGSEQQQSAIPPGATPIFVPVQQQPQQQQTSSNVINNNNVVVVGNTAPVVVEERRSPPDYLIMSVLTCLCCNWLSGIVAIILSISSRCSDDDGDVETARKLGRWALYVNIFSIVSGVVWIIIVIAVSASG